MSETTAPKTSKAPKPDKAAQELQAVQDKIASFPEPYRTIAGQIHAAVLAAGPKLKPRLWYGMPGYATGRTAPVLVFFRVDGETVSFGLSEKGRVDREPGAEHTLRPSAWFINEFNDATAVKIGELVRMAFG